MAEGGQPLPLSDHGLMADDAELEAELFGEELPSLETASASGPFPFAKQSSTPAHAENDGAQASERVREEVGAEILFEEPVEQEQLLQTKVKSASGVVGQAKKILNGSEALGKMEKRGDEDVLQATLYGASAGVDAGAEEKRAELNEQMDANKPRETEPMVATTRVEEVPAPDAEDEDELYGALYGDVDDEPLLGGEEASQLTAEETGQVKLRVNETLEPEAFGILPVEEDVAKLAAVVGLTAPEAEEEEDSESEDSDSEDDFEILVNDDQFRPAVGHSAMPPISRVPARAEGDGDEESDSDSDAFTIILDDEGAGPAAGMKRGMEDEPGLQREYSLKVRRTVGLDNPCRQQVLCALCCQAGV